MAWTWQTAVPFDGDPLTHWLSDLEDRGGATSLWYPCILYVPALGRRGREASDADLLAALARLDGPATWLTANPHDLFQWLFTALRYPDQTSELVLFERAGTSADKGARAFAEALLLALFPGQTLIPELLGSGTAIDLSLQPGSDDKGARALIAEVRAALARAQSTLQDDRPPMVISAIIDHGVPFLNMRFASGPRDTRILAHWQQGAQVAPAGSAPRIGAVIDQTEINARLAALDVTPGASERGLSQAIGLPDPDRPHRRGDNPLARSTSHGAMVLDLAAGGDAEQDGTVPWRILSVDLPPQIVRQTNGANLAPYAKSAMNWIRYRVLQEEARGLRVSVVLTYAFGGYANRRDGQGLLDSDFQLRLERGEFASVNVSAGNSYLKDFHAVLTPAQQAAGETLEVVVPADTTTPSFVQIWLDTADAPCPLSLRFGPPGAAVTVPELKPGEAADLVPASGQAPVARAYYRIDDPKQALPAGMTATARGRLVLAIAPSAWRSDARAVAPVGRWPLTVTAQHATRDLPLWIERGDSIAGFPRDQRQARFEHPGHDPLCQGGRPDESPALDRVIRRFGTLSDDANAPDATVAAAFRGARTPLRPAYYTSAGGGAVAGQPDLSAVTEYSHMRRNRLPTGTGSTGRRRFSGTSAAAAIAAREAAVFLLANPQHIGRADAGAALRAALNALLAPVTITAPGCRVTPAPERSGAGVLPVRNELSVPRS